MNDLSDLERPIDTRVLTVPTYTASIYVGLKRGYDGEIQDAEIARQLIQKYVDAVGLAATFSSTEFIYSNGKEPGIIVGLINYPRFPSTPAKIRERAIDLAVLLRGGLGQIRVSIVFPDTTMMIGDAND